MTLDDFAKMVFTDEWKNACLRRIVIRKRHARKVFGIEQPDLSIEEEMELERCSILASDE
jgi:hypothetical protein